MKLKFVNRYNPERKRECSIEEAVMNETQDCGLGQGALESVQEDLHETRRFLALFIKTVGVTDEQAKILFERGPWNLVEVDRTDEVDPED